MGQASGSQSLAGIRITELLGTIPRGSDLVSLGWSPRVCILTSPGATGAAGPETAFENHRDSKIKKEVLSPPDKTLKSAHFDKFQ